MAPRIRFETAALDELAKAANTPADRDGQTMWYIGNAIVYALLEVADELAEIRGRLPSSI